MYPDDRVDSVRRKTKAIDCVYLGLAHFESDTTLGTRTPKQQDYMVTIKILPKVAIIIVIKEWKLVLLYLFIIFHL